MESIENNHIFSQNNTIENEDEAYKGFDNRYFKNNVENIDDNFGNIFSENDSFHSHIEEYDEKNFELKFPENLIKKMKVMEKKLIKHQN